MRHKKLKIAVPTLGNGGLQDLVSDVFGRANTFTLIELQDESIRGVSVLANPTRSYRHGAGPIVVRMLFEEGVTMVIAGEIGPGASELLEQYDIPVVTVKPGLPVKKALETVLSGTVSESKAETSDHGGAG